MTTIATLRHPAINSGVAVRILCDNITVSGKRNNIATPNVNINEQTTVQTQSFENLLYNISNIYFTDVSGTLTYPMILALYRAKYDNTSSTECILNVTYNNNTLVGVDGTTTDIKVVLDNFNFPINVKESKNGYMPVGSISLRETK